MLVNIQTLIDEAKCYEAASYVGQTASAVPRARPRRLLSPDFTRIKPIGNATSVGRVGANSMI
ncbi:hypothetical protein TFLX_04478 [Thermoflexales bacterium]|nr:hypothetical protein TFLX_04478 [Thermoflexales bacterium]